MVIEKRLAVDLQLTDEVVVVTGGANGLGKAIVDAFRQEGAIALPLDRHASAAADGYVVDVTNAAQLADVAGQIRQRFGRCDHLVHAAAIGSGKFGFPFWRLQPEDWTPVLEINLVGAVNVAHAFGPGMAVAKTGTMLFIASVAGQIGSQTDPPYSASKAALINFSQCAAKDLAPFGVRVNSLCPGMVKTALNRGVYESWAADQPEASRPDYESWAAEKIAKLVPLNRWQEPEDIAAMAVFLASKKARNVTGQTINVDGGYVMHW